jgi:hypothetical protein
MLFSHEDVLFRAPSAGPVPVFTQDNWQIVKYSVLLQRGRREWNSLAEKLANNGRRLDIMISNQFWQN